MLKLTVSADNSEELSEALETLVVMVKEGYLGGKTENGIVWDIEED